VIDNLRKIPSEGEQFAWQGHRFEVVDMDGHRIDKVLITPPVSGSGVRDDVA